MPLNMNLLITTMSVSLKKPSSLKIFCLELTDEQKGALQLPKNTRGRLSIFTLAKRWETNTVPVAYSKEITAEK